MLAIILGGWILAPDLPHKRLLMSFVSIKPVSTIINRLQQISPLPNNAECLVKLKRQDVAFRPQASFSEPMGCNVEHAVRLARIGETKLDNAPLLTCRMALQLSKFERSTLQPNAKRILGVRIKRLKHIGTYNCRSMRQYQGLLSQHAFANAIDVSGFVLDDGRVINVEKDWNGAGSKSRFLEAIASSACRSFHVSVTPDGDVNHFNHFHWDVGPYRSCN
ncbi:MAG: extensin family protein [Rhodospirillaceae bacterium]|nr:extensin family protein [Rhodospirillaceae bacterium]